MSEKKLRILLAEGEPGETAAALRALYPEGQDGLELTNVSSVSTLIATLEITNPEVILLDLSLAQPDPVDAVRRVHRSAPAAPLIVLADPVDKNRAVRCLGQGALAYLMKGFIDPRTLERALRPALERNTLDGLADLLRDPLTGVYIRDGFLTRGTRHGNGQKQGEHARLAVHENRKSGSDALCIWPRRRREFLARGGRADRRLFPRDGHRWRARRS